MELNVRHLAASRPPQYTSALTDKVKLFPLMLVDTDQLLLCVNVSVTTGENVSVRVSLAVLSMENVEVGVGVGGGVMVVVIVNVEESESVDVPVAEKVAADPEADAVELRENVAV